MTNFLTKIIRTVSFSSVIALTLVAIPANAASFRFVSGASQLDQDPIDDFATNVGETLSFTNQIDTTGLSAPLTSIDIEFSYDTTELSLEQVNVIDDQIFEITVFPPVIDDMGISTQSVNFTAFSTGQDPNTILDRDNLVLDVVGLQNDGLADIQLNVTSAIDGNR